MVESNNKTDELDLGNVGNVREYFAQRELEKFQKKYPVYFSNNDVSENEDLQKIKERIKDTSIEHEGMKDTPSNSAKNSNKRKPDRKKIIVTLLVAAGIALGAVLIGTGIKKHNENENLLNEAKVQAAEVLKENNYRIEGFDELDPSIQNLYKTVVWDEAIAAGKNASEASQIEHEFLSKNREIPDNYYDYDKNDPMVYTKHEEQISREVNEFINQGMSSRAEKEVINMTKNGELTEALSESNVKSGRSL